MVNVIQLPEKNQIASFDVDAQNTFTPLCANELPVPKGDEIVGELNEQALFARFRLGSKDAHHPKAIWIADESHPPLSELTAENADCYWPPHAIVGTKGFELLSGLPSPNQYDFFVWKGIELNLHPYGACYHDLKEKQSTGVIEFLSFHQVTTVIVGGLALDYCVKTTALQLAKAKFSVILNLNACRGISCETIESAISEMKNYQIEIINSVEELS